AERTNQEPGGVADEAAQQRRRRVGLRKEERREERRQRRVQVEVVPLEHRAQRGCEDDLSHLARTERYGGVGCRHDSRLSGAGRLAGLSLEEVQLPLDVELVDGSSGVLGLEVRVERLEIRVVAKGPP